MDPGAIIGISLSVFFAFIFVLIVAYFILRNKSGQVSKRSMY